jgi:hypothetical protein
MFEKSILSKGHENRADPVTDYHISGCVGCYAACPRPTNRLRTEGRHEPHFGQDAFGDAIVYCYAPVFF